jgi:hypothetical protein
MTSRRAVKPLFSLAPVAFRESPIEGRGVFARRAFRPGEVVVAYAPRQRKLPLDDPAAIAAAQGKLTLLSEGWAVIIPDESVPGGWLCKPLLPTQRRTLLGRRRRVQCRRPIAPGEEVTLFYGWVTVNQPGRDPCRCGAPGCRGTINFDLTDDDARALHADTEAGRALRARLAEYGEYLRSIGQEQVIELIAERLAQVARRLGLGA